MGVSFFALKVCVIVEYFLMKDTFTSLQKMNVSLSSGEKKNRVQHSK